MARNVEGHTVGGPYDTPKLTCSGCGRDVWPRVGSYWFLLLAERGRCHFPGVRGLQAVLCGPCGRRIRELLESNGVSGPAAVSAGSPAREFMTGP